MNRTLDGLFHRRGLRRWRRAARAAPDAALDDLRRQRNAARRLRAHLDQLIHVADGRLALPKVGNSHFPRPHGTDWSWRPELWRGPLPVAGLAPVPSRTMLGGEATLFHDCTIAELSLRQLRNTRDEDLAPYGLRLDVFKFDGSFLSLVIDLPASAAADLTRTQLMRVDTIIETEEPIRMYARLNVRHGPNTEQLVREMPPDGPAKRAEFDLAYSHLNEKRIEKLWLDLVFDAPRMNQIILRDLTFARYRRAAI